MAARSSTRIRTRRPAARYPRRQLAHAHERRRDRHGSAYWTLTPIEVDQPRRGITRSAARCSRCDAPVWCTVASPLRMRAWQLGYGLLALVLTGATAVAEVVLGRHLIATYRWTGWNLAGMFVSEFGLIPVGIAVVLLARRAIRIDFVRIHHGRPWHSLREPGDSSRDLTADSWNDFNAI